MLLWALMVAGMQTAAVASGGGGEEEALWLPLADGAYWHRGHHRGVEDEGRDDIANAGLVIGDDCMAIIDAGGSVAVGRRLLAAARAISDRPLCYVISTHIHFDHVLGNAALTEEGVNYVGHHALQDELINNRDFFRENFAEELAGATVPDLDTLVQGEMTLDLGGRSLQLRSWSAAHTHCDLTVRDSRSGVLWTGDLLFRGRLPVLDGSLRGWVAIMREIQTIAANRIVPGHGDVSDGWPEAIAAQEQYLSWLLETVRHTIAEGMFLEDAISSLHPPDKDQWVFFQESAHRTNVSRAFTELEWE